MIYWLRRDLRLSDHPGLSAAVSSGMCVIPVFVLDPLTQGQGAAHRWRLGIALDAFDAALREIGSRLILRRGDAVEVLRDLADQTGAAAVHWSRLYDPGSVDRDKGVKSALREAGLDAVSHPGHVLFEPWTVETGQGSFYKVYTPYWKAVRDRDLDTPLPEIAELKAPKSWPESLSVAALDLGRDMHRGAQIVKKHIVPGEAAARARLDDFIANKVADYGDARDLLGRDGTSGLSENLAFGEISARSCWHAGQRAMAEGARGAEQFVKEVVWRDFAYHLAFHTPHLVQRNWREEWDGFDWRGDNADAERWRRGRTGEPVIDAAMREMYVTGRMHNRARMLVASYLTKHLLTDWKVGMDWFAECLIDWDPASNAMGWQWAAGCGPDAAPYFRIFNPATQAEKFDKNETYRRRWIAEGKSDPGEDACDYFRAIPESWGLSAKDPYPEPMVDLKAGREAALEAYRSYKDNEPAA